MFDTKSDFALNKFDQDAIVCRSVTGIHIRLTREDYYDTEKDGRGFYDNSLPLDPRVDKLGAVPSVEADILTMLDAAEASAGQARRTAALIEQIKSCLTGTQYRRLWMLYARKMNVTAIARAEGISKASASRSISAALKNISAFFPEGGENR